MPLLYRIWRWCLFPKFQILVVASVFGLMTFLTMRPSITQAFGIVSIDPVGIRDFYSAAAQGVAALVGLVLAFLIFDLQSVEASREAAYGNFMGAIERALPLLRDLPDNFHSVHHVVYPLLTHYATTRRMFLPDVEELKGRIPLRTPEYDNFHSAMIDLIEVGNEATENSKVKQEEHTRYLALVCVLTQADEWLSVFVELWRRVNVIHLAIRVLFKLVVIFAVLLGGSFLYSLTSHGRWALQLDVPIACSIFSWICLLVAELTYCLRYNLADYGCRHQHASYRHAAE